MAAGETERLIMSQENAIETKAQAEELIIGGGVELSDGRLAHAEGEGRQRRYYLDDENVSKGDVIDAVMEDDGAAEAGSGDPEGIVCRVCGEEKGYLTGSHMGTHDEGEPQTVAEYRDFVAAEDGIDPDDVPLASEDMYDRFASGGHSNDEETREKIRESIKARWEDGKYDHLRSADDDEEADDEEADDEEAVEAEA